MQFTIADAAVHLRRSEWPAQHGTEVLLELAGVRALDRPVAGVVDARRQLVGQELAIVLEQLDREHADVVEVVEEAQRDRLPVVMQ